MQASMSTPERIRVFAVDRSVPSFRHIQGSLVTHRIALRFLRGGGTANFSSETDYEKLMGLPPYIHQFSILFNLAIFYE